MRYAEPQYGEFPTAHGIFTTGDTVTIEVFDGQDPTGGPLAIGVGDDACDEIERAAPPHTGRFVWNSSLLTDDPTGFTELHYIMTNQNGRQHDGKLVVGGYPSDSAIRRFQGSVHIDVVGGQNGEDFPRGTPEDPVKNLVDARAIADRENLTAYTVIGALTVDTDHLDWSFEGNDPVGDVVTVQSGTSVAGSQFLQIGIKGALTGKITAKECLIGGFGLLTTGLDGTFTTCGFDGTIQPAESPAKVQGLDLASQSQTLSGSSCILDFNGKECFVIGEFKGLWEIHNITEDASIVAFALQGSHITLDFSIKTGIFILLGYGEITDNKDAAAIFIDNVLRGSRVDVATSTRTIQADILSDAIPFNGADIDAAISSRAVPGDEMDLETDAVDANAVATSGAQGIRDEILDDATRFSGADIPKIVDATYGRRELDTSNPAQWQMIIYDNDNETTPMKTFNLKDQSGNAINAANNPLILGNVIIADRDPV